MNTNIIISTSSDEREAVAFGDDSTCIQDGGVQCAERRATLPRSSDEFVNMWLSNWVCISIIIRIHSIIKIHISIIKY